MNALTIEECVRIAPSIGAERPHQGVSDKYTFLPTTETLKAFQTEGWVPTRVQQARVRNPESPRQGYQKHVIHLTHETSLERKHDEIVQLILENSHDRTSPERMRAGVYRLVCTNGMVVAKSVFTDIRIMHIWNDRSTVNKLMLELGERLRKVDECIQQWGKTKMPGADRTSFAERAMELRYGSNPGVWPITPFKLLEVRRPEDERSDLWTTFNIVQENLIKGGQYETTRVDANGRWFQPTKPITSITRDLTLNEKLWELASLYANN